MTKGASSIHLGDSTDFDWAAVLPGPINCIVTDPPFGVDYQSRRGKTRRHDEINALIANDDNVDDAVACFLDAFDNVAPHCADECELYVFTRWDIIVEWVGVMESLMRYGFKYKALLVWDKQNLGMGDIDASWGASHELILYGKRGRRDMNHQRSSVLSFDRPPGSSRIHPTEKPTALLETLIGNSANEGDVVVDLFAGSGSTLEAARRLGMHAVGVEKDPEFHQRAQQRLTQALLF